MNVKTVKLTEAADRLGMSDERLRVLCKQRRVPGARLIGKLWRVPADLRIDDIAPGTRGPELGRSKERRTGVR